MKRSQRQHEVVNEISDQWGKEVLIYGPVLKVPYKTFHEKTVRDAVTNVVRTETTEEIKYGYFFPEQLHINSKIDPEPKQYGIYKTTVYQSGMAITGQFAKPDFSQIDVKDEHIVWDKAKIIFQTSNLKGVNDQVVITMNENDYGFSAKIYW